MSKNKIIDKQLSFYSSGSAGCMFAAIAAKNPSKYGWKHIILGVNYQKIDLATTRSIADNTVTTLSLIFPSIENPGGLVRLVKELQFCKNIFLEQRELFKGSWCLGFRARVGKYGSWISGFGNFEFFPETRRSPYVELIFRVKPRPAYDWVLKESPRDTIHVADLDMIDLSEKQLRRNWNNSFKKTAATLDHKPDLKSAAKTTFSIPEDILEE